MGATNATDPVSLTSTSSTPEEFYYCYSVTDNASPPASVLSATDLVTVDLNLTAGPALPTAPTIDRGRSVTLTAEPSSGTAPYGYLWYGGSSANCTGDLGIPRATNATELVAPMSTTYYCYEVTDSSNGTPAENATSSTDLVTVNPPLSAEPVGPNAPTIEVGQSVTLTANASGGTPFYSYRWHAGSSPTCASDLALPGATNNTTVASPGTSTYYCYEVTDGSVGPPTLLSATDLVTVVLEAGPPERARPVIDEGQSVTLSAEPEGGMPPYNYQWYEGTSLTCASNAVVAGEDHSTYAVSPGVSTYFCYALTDQADPPDTAFSAVDLVTVDPELQAGRLTTNASTVHAGGFAQLAAHPSGGTPPYRYQWFGGGSPNCSLDAAIPGATGETYQATPTSDTYYCYSASDNSTDPPTVLSPTQELVLTGPSGSSPPWTYVAVGGVLAAGTVVGAIALLRRRRK